MWTIWSPGVENHTRSESLYDVFRAAAGPGLPTARPAAKPGAARPAYIGIALVLRPGHGGFDVFLPATAVEPVRKLVEPLLDDK